MNISDNDILNAFNTVLPFLPKLFDDEISFAITNRKEFLVNQSCQSLQLKNKKGDPIGEAGGAFQAITTEKTIVKEVPKEVYGIQFRSYAVPINDADGNVVGAILAGKSLARSKEVLENINGNIENISTDVVDSNGVFEDQAASLQEISSSLEQLNETAKILEKLSKKL